MVVKTATIEMMFNGDEPLYFLAERHGSAYVEKALFGFAHYKQRVDEPYTPTQWMKLFAARWAEDIIPIEQPKKVQQGIVFMPERKKITYRLTEPLRHPDLWERSQHYLVQRQGYTVKPF